MPAGIKQQEPGLIAPMANDDARSATKMVPAEEFNKLKRKLEEEKADNNKKAKQLESLKTLVAADVQFRPKRAQIRLNLLNLAKSIDQLKDTDYSCSSDTVEIAGFHWQLDAWGFAKNTWIAVSLYANPPDYYKGAYEFGIDCTFRLFNAFSSKDIRKEMNNKKIQHHCCLESIGVVKFAELKNLLNPKSGFLQADGSVQLEADFTVKTATLNHFLEMVENGTGSGH